LIWEAKTTTADLHNKDSTFKWYNSNTSTNGGSIGSTGGTCYHSGYCDTEKFTTDVNSATLCGYNDWRLPSVKELEGLLDLSKGSSALVPTSAIDQTYFPNIQQTHYRTATASGLNSTNAPSYAWTVDFGSGFVFPTIKSNSYPVMLVRGQ
jgi:hypothetical protein